MRIAQIPVKTEEWYGLRRIVVELHGNYIIISEEENVSTYGVQSNEWRTVPNSTLEIELSESQDLIDAIQKAQRLSLIA